MATTTIRLDELLKRRVAAAAARAGKSAHAFIVEAIEHTIEQSEFDAELGKIADARWERFVEDGKAVSWKDARKWLLARAKGKPARKPAPRRQAR